MRLGGPKLEVGDPLAVKLVVVGVDVDIAGLQAAGPDNIGV